MHLTSYDEAVEAYKDEALKQLKELTKKAKAGKRNLMLDLVEPIDNSQHYDELLEMFELEVEEVIQLEKHEYNEFVNDKTHFAEQAMFANTTYIR
jgi:hypothetical protein